MAHERLDKEDDPVLDYPETKRCDDEVIEAPYTDQVILRGERDFKNQIINYLVGHFTSVEKEVGSFS